MRRPLPFRLNRSGLLLALVSAAFAGQAGAAAGRAEFTIGGVTLARNGVERPLTRGTELDNGDVVRTNDGRAQIRFTDGAYVSLQPNTEFGIREYLFQNRTDGSERGFFGLVKGAMRTVTGLIGRVNRDRYQITTPTATVGIRGTGGVIQVLPDGSTLVIGTSGIWSLSNPAGSIDVPAGVSGLAPSDPNEPPKDTTTQPTSGPAPLPDEEQEFVQGEERNVEGEIVIAPTEPGGGGDGGGGGGIVPLKSGSGYAGVMAWPGFSSPDLITSGTATFNAAGQLTKLDDGFRQWTLLNGAQLDFGTDGILAWGRWTGEVSLPADGQITFTIEPNHGVHYVVGVPTPTLPASGGGTYTLLGATRPTYTSGTVAPGVFSGTLDVTFGATPTVGLNFRVAMPDRTYDINTSRSGPIPVSGSHFSSGQLPLTVNGCFSSCSARVDGFFAGPAAERAGVGYRISDSPNQVVGAAAFKKP